jgi:hypothetical protein
MKKCYSLLLCVFLSFVIFGVSSAFANQRTVTLAWDPSPEADIDGYRIYQSRESGVYPQTPAIPDIDPTHTSASIGLTEDGTYYWVATCFDTQGNESAYSNEVSWTVDFTQPGAIILRFEGWQ